MVFGVATVVFDYATEPEDEDVSLGDDQSLFRLHLKGLSHFGFECLDFPLC